MNEAMLTFVKEYEELFKTSNWTEIYKNLQRIVVNGTYGTVYQNLGIGQFTLALKDLGLYPHLNPNMTSIPWAYLRYIKSVKEFYVPSHIKYIEPVAFLGSSIKDIHIQEGCEVIGSSSFKDCKSLIDIKLPSSLKLIEESAFQSTGLARIDIPGPNLKIIQEQCFAYNDNLESITLPEGLTKLENRVFYRCPHLKEVTLPDSLTEIGDMCFYVCEKLEKVSLNLNNLNFGKTVFGGGLKHLTSIIHRGPMKDVRKWITKARWKADSYISKIICDDGEIEL